MKVAYWGNRRKSGVTCALAAIGVTAVLAYPFKITIFENHYNENGVTRYLFPRRWLYRVAEVNPGAECFFHGGSNGMEQGRAPGEYPVIEVLEKGLYYVPQFTKNPDLFDYQFHFNLLPMLEDCPDIAFIDTRRENSISSKTILEEAEVAVVLLRQDMYEIQNFFQNYSSLVPKTFFIINDYQRKNPVNLTKIISEFGFRDDCIGIIPHSDEFKMAADYGRLIEYITSNYTGTKYRENRYFMQELKKTTFLLMQKVVFNREFGDLF